jgi:hypothetical protein
MTCKSSAPCGEEGFDHTEHQLCLSCKRRVPIPQPTWAFANSVTSCDKCNPTRTSFVTQDYREAPSGIGPHAPEWKDKPHRLVYDLASEVDLLRKLLWLRHDPNHYAGLYGDDGEMQCGACGIDFKRMSAVEIESRWQQDAMRKLIESQLKAEPPKLVCQDCGGPDAEEGFCPYASDVHNRDVPVVLCKSCYHDRVLDV